MQMDPIQHCSTRSLSPPPTNDSSYRRLDHLRRKSPRLLLPSYHAPPPSRHLLVRRAVHHAPWGHKTSAQFPPRSTPRQQRLSSHRIFWQQLLAGVVRRPFRDRCVRTTSSCGFGPAATTRGRIGRCRADTRCVRLPTWQTVVDSGLISGGALLPPLLGTPHAGTVRSLDLTATSIPNRGLPGTPLRAKTCLPAKITFLIKIPLHAEIPRPTKTPQPAKFTLPAKTPQPAKTPAGCLVTRVASGIALP